MTHPFDGWTQRELAVLQKLASPARIQSFLDRFPYNHEPVTRCPRQALRAGRANCFEGALLAAAAIRRLGHPPLLIDLRAVNDDDHVLCVFRVRERWGAIGKSNFVGLRFREPIYYTIREVCVSYFEQYFNSIGQKTLRSYSVPVDLRRCDRFDWMGSDRGVEVVEERLDSARHHRLLTPAMVGRLQRVDGRSLEAGLMGSNPAGLYKPRGRN